MANSFARPEGETQVKRGELLIHDISYALTKPMTATV